MPASGNPIFGGTLDPDTGMPSAHTFENEFLFDDEINTESASTLFGIDAADPSTLAAFESAALGDSKALFATPVCQDRIADFSPPSHRDSSSSGSSRRSAGSSSPKTSHTSGDVMMTEETFGEWKGFEGLSHHHDPNIDMLAADSLDQHMDSTTHFADSNFFDFDSASNSPSPPTTNGHASVSPGDHMVTAHRPIKSPGLQRRGKGHGKSSLHNPLTHGLNGFRAGGSREASPNFASQESSPAAMFKDSPPSESNMNMPKSFNFRAPGHESSWHAPGTFSAQRQSAMSHSLEMPSNSGMTYSGPAFGGKPTLKILPTPLKSRVETQIPIKLTFHNLPPNIKRLHLPRHSISKAKLLAKAPVERTPEMLELYTMLVCTSAMQDREKSRKAFERAAVASRPTNPDPCPETEEDKPQNGGEVRICQGCITRERKRAGRKKNKKPEEDELWDRYQNYRAIVFNTQEVKEWQVATDTGIGISPPPGTMQVDVPMRIACYCRHHQEKMGFQVIFTLKDCSDNVVVQEISNPIMITDDHKTHIPTTTTTPTSHNDAPGDGMSLETPLAFRQTHPTSDLHGLPQQNPPGPVPAASKPNHSQSSSVTATPRSLSRQASPTSPMAPSAKRRKPSASKLPQNLAMTRLETIQPPPALSSSQAGASAVSSATSPFSPNMNNFPVATQLFPQGQQPSLGPMQQSFATGPPTPNSNNEQVLYPGTARNISIDNLPMSQSLYSAPASAHPSRAPSPNQLRNEMNALQQQAPLPQALFGTEAVGMGALRAPTPTIHKIIPGEGPKDGGIEVTVLGSGFTNGGLEVMFGEHRALTTTYWGESSLVCLLPPSRMAGHVLVRIRHPQMPEQAPSFGGKQPPVFRYIDDSEEQLMRTALVCLGNKLGGTIQDATDIARSIISSRSNQGGWGLSPGASAQGPGGYNFRDVSLETGLLKVLELMDLDDSVNKAKINMRRSATGQSMLHLACSRGMGRFVAGLLSRGANVGARDKGGFTPLHFAAMNDHVEIVRRLMICGADPTMRSLSGLTATDVAQSREVRRVLRRVEDHARSRSGGSLHSRVNSATSLRSLWDPPSALAYHEDASTDSSLPMNSSDDEYEDSSEAGEGQSADGDGFLQMRRLSAPRTHQLPEIVSPAPAEVHAGMASPTAAVTALQERVLQQWQTMLQNWQQFQMPPMPQMPQLPGRPTLPDYHNMLNNAQIMQRFASLVPNISGSRPGSVDGQSPREGDKQWWEIPSFFGTKEAPPAYEDIFPQKDMDTKQATAAAAAAEYEADAKCATLYDEAESAAAESSQAREVPTLLQIGRKNAITKEQQEDLQRAHAARLKTGSSDKMLWFVWLPLLIFILGAMVFNGAPAVINSVAKLTHAVVSLATSPGQALERTGRVAVDEL